MPQNPDISLQTTRDYNSSYSNQDKGKPTQREARKLAMQAVVSFAGPAVDQEEGSAKSHLHSCKASWPTSPPGKAFRWDVGLSEKP